MRDLINVNLDKTSKNLDAITFLSDSDIIHIKENFCKPFLIADTPDETFKGLSFKYDSSKHSDIRRALRASHNDFNSFYDKTNKKMNYSKIQSDFNQISKIELIDLKGVRSGIYLINFKVKARKYCNIYFDFNKVKTELNQSKGEKIKS